MSNKTRGLFAEIAGSRRLQNRLGPDNSWDKKNRPLTPTGDCCYTLSAGVRGVSMTAGPAKKREFIRVPFNTTVVVRVQDRVIRSKGEINISMGGIRLPTRDAIPPAEALCRVTINLGGSENPIHIEVRGTIIRSREGSLAIKFIDLDIDSYQHLRQLIVNNADDPDRAELEFVAHWGTRRPLQ
jgi:hypothetical protein